ncbi:uncharacterized protein N0V89_010625 [Didymosphaeria variabile]|uniref:Uncharacterized protein n=1 Tax=Didymosphaeria variabile TaxID=1932322 RepID=A0A9W8XC52_9PLEO|nr:uncharacterized protein N0V89_010625 [Didymosphaeria variabile]KAJ4346693.1 hypothetical protein N0V89_010625 [Didymosphaeria variabile]
MSDPKLKAELYRMARKELQLTHIPMIKKVANELDDASEAWYPKILTLSAQVNAGSDEKMVEVMREASEAMAKYEKVLSDVAPKLKEWKDLLAKWGGPEGPAPGPTAFDS